jgi:hypothetical protein
MTKPVPYYPLFAANLIASKPFRLMTLEERGLWITIQMECWVNGAVPSNLDELAKYLGVTSDEVHRCFTKTQMSFLVKEEGQFKSPELEAQRKEYLERREKQRIGGIDGARRKKAKQEVAMKIGIPEGPPEGSLSYINSNQLKSSSLMSNQLVERRFSTKEIEDWIDDYENTEDTKY